MPGEGSLKKLTVGGRLVDYLRPGGAALVVEDEDGNVDLEVGADGIRIGATAQAFLGLGAAETPTIADGVLTVTKPHVNPQPESSTADTVASIVYAGAQAGDLLFVHVPATNTITFDDANINLGAATRAVAPGGTLVLIYDGSEWTEVAFLAAADNS